MLAAAPAVLTACRITSPWVVGAAAAGASVAVVVAAVWQERQRRMAARRGGTALRTRDGCLVLADGRLPKVGQVGDPIAVGVHPAIAPTGGRTGEIEVRAPVYVPRDRDGELRERLVKGGFVLLVGDSTAGKSRAAFEGIHEVLSDHVLVVPRDREALAAAVERTVRESRAVLWLNDLEAYLGTGGLTGEQVGRLVGGNGHHRVIMATLRSAEHARLTGEPADADDAARLAGRAAREVLEQAHLVRLQRMFTPGECERARSRAGDGRIRSALEHAGEVGIAEYLATGPQLRPGIDDA